MSQVYFTDSIKQNPEIFIFWIPYSPGYIHDIAESILIQLQNYENETSFSVTVLT